MRVYFNRRLRREPWGGGAHFHSAMVDHLVTKGHTVAERLEKGIDVIFMLDPRHEEGGADAEQLLSFKQRNPRVKLLHRVNECDQRKGTHGLDEMLLKSMHAADRVVFISEWLRSYFTLGKHFYSPYFQSDVITNGCNNEWFHPAKYERDFSKHPIKLVTHHWSDNRMKGFDVYDWLDSFVDGNPRFEFAYIGRYNSTYEPKNTRLMQPMYGPKLGQELRRHDVYVTASRFEPCGMHHIEGAACGLPVLYHRDGGGINEIASKHGEVFHDAASFEEALTRVIDGYDEYRSRIDHQQLSMERCCGQYLEIMQDMTG